MFKIYLCHSRSLPFSWSVVWASDLDSAIEAFSNIVNCIELDGFPLLAVFAYRGKTLAIHRFMHNCGEPCHWRGRMQELRLANRN